MALALAEAGASVACVARSEEDLRETARLVEELGRQSMIIGADITDIDDVAAIPEKVIDTFDKIDILVNNAGIIVGARFLDTSPKDWERVLNTNLIGAVNLTRVVGRILVEQGHGKVINISSAWGTKPVPEHSAYCVTKAGLIQLTQVLAAEWARYNINVNCIAPGYFDTAIPAPAMAMPKLREVILKSIPLRRLGRPDEIGALAVYLASEASQYMTGSVIAIDGGMLVR
jgi:NAD(P)-dependent dehydrogenase (short-subunit alcohol dehydrogenase family)